MPSRRVDLHAALDLQRRGHFAQAEQLYRQALAIDPDNSHALHLLGVVFFQTKRLEEAVLLMQRAISIHPEVPAYHNNLGEALRELDRSAEAIASYRRALQLQPIYPQALNNLGGELGRIGRLPEAIACLRRCIAVQPDSADGHWNLAVALLLSEQWDQGWHEFEWRLRRPDTPGRIYQQPLWNGHPLIGKTLLLWWEQGFGDIVQFFRYVSMVKSRFGGRIIVEVQPLLCSLLREQNIADAVYSAGEPLPLFDYHQAIMSLPCIMGTSLQTVPDAAGYLKPPQSRLDHWKDRFPHDGKRRVGLACAGRPEHPNDRRRSIPTELLSQLSTVDDCTFFTVQPRPATQPPPTGLRLFDFGRELTDFADTAGLLSQLDLLISVDTSVAHLAGAIGLPTWLLLPFSPDWRWLMHREDTPWYHSLHLFRQSKLGDWPGVIQQVVERLREPAK